jgi:hypothetical protein
VKWALGRSYTNSLLSGAKVAANISQGLKMSAVADTMPACEIIPINERQVRPLIALEPALQVEIWKEAVESAGGKVVTHDQVRALVKERIGSAPPSPPKPKVPYVRSDANALAFGVHHPDFPPPRPGTDLILRLPDCAAATPRSPGLPTQEFPAPGAKPRDGTPTPPVLECPPRTKFSKYIEGEIADTLV